jgi:hypothetical protein
MFERTSAGMGTGAEPAPSPGPRELSADEGASSSLRLQILATEHWSLLASRSLAWNESFSRAGMFLTTLTGSIVALALVAQASAFGDGFTLFALVILPVVLFIGVATHIRLGAANYHEALCVTGMNRIRAAYLELAPDLERYFVMSAHDDQRGMAITMGMPPGLGAAGWIAHMIASTPTVVVVLNGALAGVIAALAALRLGMATPAILAVGVAGLVVAIALHILYARGRIAETRSRRPLFPTPDV